MTLSAQLVWSVVVVLCGMAVIWGDMRRQVWSNRERQDERHTENQKKLDAIGADLKRINGSVARHEEQLENHQDEIERLRNQRARARRR